MTDYTYGQLQTIWLDAAKGTKYATDAWARLMAAIALAESSGNPNATNPTDNGGTQTSWGLWQISLGNHNEPASNWNDPAENAKLAIGKLDDQGLGAWGTYTSGAYKHYMEGSGPTPTPTGSGSGSGSGQSSAGISWNPLSWVEAPIKGYEWAGKFLIHEVTAPVSAITNSFQSIEDVAKAIAGLVKTLSKIAQLFLLLFNPSFWLRVGAFLVGLISLILAVRMMGETL